jgi:hypothetical protein
VRRGAEILAAVHLLSVHPAQNHSPAGGTEARNTSRVSVWDWKPHREIALAERISERRRLKTAEARERAREEKTLSKRGPPPGWEKTMGVGDVDDTDITYPVSSIPTEETRAKMYKTWAEKELERSRKRRAEGMEQMSKENLKEGNLNLPVLYGSESADPATLNTVLVFPRRRETINWNYPNWNDGYDIPNLNLPPALDDNNFTTATVASSDQFLRTQTIKESVDGISIPYSYRRPPSEPVSPKSKPIDAGLTYTSEETSTGYPTTDSDQQRAKSSALVTPPTTVSQSTSGTQSRAGGSQRFRKFRSTLKNVFPRIPWSSVPRNSDCPAIMASNSVAESSFMSRSSARKKQRLRPIPWSKDVISPSEPSKQASETALLTNNTTTEEHSEVEEKLTRTEREYQEVLEALQQLKREMMQERSERRRRSSSRTRRAEPNGQSRETVRWWLCDVE